MPCDARMTPARPSRTRYLLYAIVLVAGVLRLARLDLMAFEMDEAVACIQAIRFTHYGLWPLLGVKTSFQFYNSPLFIYVISPAFLVTTDARFAALLFALLGMAGVYVVYRTGREFFSPAVGLVAAAMLAVSPAAVEYSRRLWGHSLIQVLCPVVFYLMLRWVVAGRAKAIFWLALIAGAAQQFHFSGALLWGQLVLAYLLFRPRTDWIGFVCGLVLGLVGYLPYFIAEADLGLDDLGIIGQLIWRGTGEPWSLGLGPLVYWLLAVTDLGHNNFLQDEFAPFLARIPLYRVTRAAVGAAWIGALVGCAVCVVRDLRGGRLWRSLGEGKAARPLILLLWSLVPLVAFLGLRAQVVAPYFLVVYPAPFLAIAWAVVALWQRLESSVRAIGLRRLAQAAIVILLAAWAGHQLVFQVALRWRLDRDGGGVGSYASFGAQQKAMQFIAMYAPDRTAVVSEEYLDPRDLTKGISFRYWFLLWTFDHNMERFFPRDREKADYWYVIRNTNLHIRSDFDAFLEISRLHEREFGFLWVCVIPRPGPWPRFGP